MREYCKESKKSIIEYKFANANQKRFISHNNPVRVELVDFDPSEWDYFNHEGAEFRFRFTYDARNENHAKFYVHSGYAYKIARNGVRLLACNSQAQFKRVNSPGSDPGNRFFSSVTIDPSKKCPTPFKGYSIQIYERGTKVFSDFGDKPCTYKVKCEGQCQKEDLEIKTSGYPGYWCFTPPMQAELKRLTQKIQKTKLD